MHSQEVLKCDPKVLKCNNGSTKMRSQKVQKCDPKNNKMPSKKVLKWDPKKY